MNSQIETSNKIISVMLSSDEEYSSNDDLEKTYCDEVIPEYRKITEDSCYEFIFWANENRVSSISVDYFNMVLQSNINKWINENNITWQFALTVIIDTINNQHSITENIVSISKNEVGEADEADEAGEVGEAGEAGEADEAEAGEADEAGEAGEADKKPQSNDERRKLFAAAAEKRAAKRF